MSKIFLLLFLFFITLKGFSQSHRDSVDVCHYRLKIDMTKMGSYSISGIAQLNLKVKYPANSIPLDLFKLTVDSVKVLGSFITFNQNDTLLRINYPVVNSDTITLDIYYHGKPKKDSRWGGFYFDDAYAYNINVGMASYPHGIGRFWYPCIDNFTDRATYDFVITTVPSHKAVCGGMLTNISDGIGSTTWVWQLKEEIPTYLASIAVGPFTGFVGNYQGILGEIPYYIYSSSKDSTGATKTFTNLKASMSVFEKYFGPYRWERIGYVVVPFNSGAMEHATNIAFPNNALSGSLDNQVLAAHELSHSWFGNLVTCSTSQDMWLNEGWASYCESIFLEGVFSKEKSLKHIIDNHYSVLYSAYRSDGGYFALNQLPPAITYGDHAYNKGADVVNTLRNYLGDSLFFSGVRDYLHQKEFSDVSSHDLMQILSESTGIDLGPFFENWIYRPGFPHYSIDSFGVIQSNNSYSVTLYMRQKSKARDYFGDKNRIPVQFIDENWNQCDTTIEFDGEHQAITVQVPILPKLALVDVNHEVGDAITDDIHEINSIGTVFFDGCDFSLNAKTIGSKALVQVQNNWIPADSLDNSYPGLVMSNLNYWKVNGIFTDVFDASARFSYQFSGCSNPEIKYTPGINDTMVLLFRSSINHRWHMISKSNNARFVSGSFKIEHLQPGEYAVAFWDGITSVNIINKPVYDKVRIFPNPSSGLFHVVLPARYSGNFSIMDAKGNQVYSEKFSDTDNLYINLSDSIYSGVYYLKIDGPFQSNLKLVKL
jgi:aminopeptidase N